MSATREGSVMAVIIGGTDEFPGRNNRLIGTREPDLVFGDPYTFETGPLSSGTAGNDVIKGLAGFEFGDETNERDVLYGDAGEITGTGRGGRDLLIGGRDTDYIVGDAEQMSGSAVGGNDRLEGGTGDDGPGGVFFGLLGDAFAMSDRARGGRDHLQGGDGDDVLIGDAYVMQDDTRGGNDRLAGGRDDDVLHGDANGISGGARGGDDTLRGRVGDDLLFGDAEAMGGEARGGRDRLIGGRGDDLLYGDADPRESNFADVVRGVDTFVFRPGDGQDTIGDFEPGKDRIVFQGFGDLGAADILDEDMGSGARTLDDSGHGSGGLVLDLGRDSVTLLGVTDLNGSDLLFG
jgi:Ca2+-binding RTX toxin-like protein